MAAAAKKKSQNKGLGRGLDALLGDVSPPKPAGKKEPQGDGKREIPIEFLIANKDQPRKLFKKEQIEELADSIARRGLLQPILVRPKGDDEYEIVAGERRWRAAQKAKLHKVPVIIRELTDEETAEIALIENVQRVDLNPLEEAQAYLRLAETYGRTQEEIARAVGKSRSHVANIIRMLKLPPRAHQALANGDISMGHARAILGADDPLKVFERVQANQLSVRETEALVKIASPSKSGAAAKKAGKSKASGGAKDADTRALERDLGAILGLDVSIAHSKKGAGEITVKYLTLDQLDDICRRLMGAGV